MKHDETKRPKVGVAVFVYKNDKYIITQRSGSHGENTWALPGGHLEFGESWEECARREVMEEVGVKITNVRFLTATNDIFTEDDKHYITIWTTSDWEANEPASQEPDKILDAHWTTFTDMPRPLFEPCWENLRAVRPDLFAQG